jgi:uncharacterized protein
LNPIRILLLPFVIVGRLIFWLLFGFAAWLLIRKLRQSGAMPGAMPGESPKSRPRDDKPVENMVACARCGLHLPESDAIKRGSEYFCSEEHRLER